jgi:hypothetical protein
VRILNPKSGIGDLDISHTCVYLAAFWVTLGPVHPIVSVRVMKGDVRATGGGTNKRERKSDRGSASCINCD